jgi:signal transduction histidine kinase
MVAFQVASIVRNARALGLLVGGAFAAVVATTLAVILTIMGIKDRAVEDANDVHRAIAIAASHAQKIADGRAYVLARDNDAYRDYESSHRATHRALRDLRERDPTGEFAVLLERVERTEASYDDAFAALVTGASNSVAERAAAWNTMVRPKAKVVDEAIDELIQREKMRASASARLAERKETLAVALLVVVIVGLLLLGALVSMLLGRSAARGLSAETRAREDAERAHGFLTALLDQLPLGVIVAEAPSGRVMHVSQTAHDLLGGPIPESTTTLDVPLARAVQGEHVRAEMTWAPTGKYFESHAAPVRDMNGDVVAAVIAFSEVTDRQRAEAERERFLDVLAHDLRNPIHAITLSAGSVLEQSTGLPERVQRAAARIQSSAERMRRLIEQLLDFARSRSGKMRLEVRSVDLVDIVRETVADVELGAPACDIRVEAVDRVMGRCDRDRLSQVFHNLIGNAVKHCAPDTPVVVEVRSDASAGVVSISNRGDTIAKEMLERIFEPFHRGKKSDGLGLGLYIARQIVQAHGGEINVASTDGVTTFTVRLPCGGNVAT